jgi:hypothetical protein
MTLAWYFSSPPDAQGRFRVAHRHRATYVVPGGPSRLRRPPILCERGYHASVHALDALTYASSPWVHRVEVSGRIEVGDDKIAGQERRHLWVMDATPVLRAFARQCALDVAHLWAMPDVVRRYLETGDESLRAAARDAAKAAARDAAWDAARAAERQWQLGRLTEYLTRPLNEMSPIEGSRMQEAAK